MPFCPACESEFRAGFERCEECDVALISELPVAPTPPAIPNPSLRPVYQTTEVSDALLVHSLLEGQGIRARLENQNSALLVMGLSTSAVPYVVSVPSGEAGDAADIVKEICDTRPAPVRGGRAARRLWLIAIAVLVPADFAMLRIFNGFEHFLAAGAWSVVVLGLLFDLHNRVKDTVFSEARILTHFVAGAVGSFAVVAAIAPWLGDLSGIPRNNPAYHFVIVGPIEEAAKLLPVLVVFCIRPSWFARPIGWFVACAAAGGGFGLTETFMKLGNRNHDSITVLGAVSSGVFHPMLSGMVGFCIAKAGAGRIPAAAAGLALAAFLHGSWNALVSVNLEWICLLAMIFATWFCVRNLGRLFPEEANQPVSSSSAPPT